MNNFKTYAFTSPHLLKKVKIVTIGFAVISCVVTGCKQKVDEAYQKVYTSVEIVSGDTLYSIAKREIDYQVYDDIYAYIEEIKKMNGLLSDTIVEGSFLIIPKIVTDEELDMISEEKETVLISYLVKEKDTLADIASFFDDSVAAICERNDIAYFDALEVGSLLSIETTKEKNEMYRFEQFKKGESSYRRK